MFDSAKGTNRSDRYAKCYKQLVQRERQWRRTRQRLIRLKQRQLVWFGNDSLIMWLLWQLVSYVVVAIVLMLTSKLLNIDLFLWQYIAIFGLQTLFLMIAFAFKGQLAKRLQHNIYAQELIREQVFNEMVILARDSIFPDIHANAPLSLQHIHERYGAQLRTISLQRLLQTEIEAGRLTLGQHQIKPQTLLPEFIDNELIPYASKMIYKSVI